MKYEDATDILTKCQVHNNGLRTLRECAELAGISYEDASEARETIRRIDLRLGAFSDQLGANVRDASAEKGGGR